MNIIEVTLSLVVKQKIIVKNQGDIKEIAMRCFLAMKYYGFSPADKRNNKVMLLLSTN